MKALSIRQPHAHRICIGRKWIEYRSWPTDHRGDLLVCSGKVPDNMTVKACQVEGWPLGCAVAIVEVVDCREGSDGYEWLLDNVRPILKPFPVRGKLGLFSVEMPRGVKLGPALRNPNPKPDDKPRGKRGRGGTVTFEL